jgi:hypothetical protein
VLGPSCYRPRDGRSAPAKSSLPRRPGSFAASRGNCGSEPPRDRHQPEPAPRAVRRSTPEGQQPAQGNPYPGQARRPPTRRPRRRIREGARRDKRAARRRALARAGARGTAGPPPAFTASRRLRSGLEPRLGPPLENTQESLATISTGKAWTMLTVSNAPRDAPGLAVRTIVAPAAHATVSLAWRATGASPLARTFIDLCVRARDHGDLDALAGSA